MGQLNENIEVHQQIRRAAGSIFNVYENRDLLFQAQKILTERAQLAFFIEKGMLKDNDTAIEQFKAYNDLLKKHLGL
jgi:hypothetical protein